MAFQVAIEFEDTAGLRGLRRAMEVLSNPDRALSKGLLACGRLVQGTARSQYLSGPRPAHLGRVTGNLARSVVVDRAGLPNYVEVGSALPYAAVHEFGATIRARGAGRMTWGQGTNGQPPLRSARQVTIPARPFIGPALEDNADKFAPAILEEIVTEAGL